MTMKMAIIFLEPVEYAFPDNKWVEDEMVKNDEGTKDEIIIDNDYSLD